MLHELEYSMAKLEVLDPSDQPVAPGKTGEIVAEGDNVTLGYWKAPEETARSFANGRLYTGDLATVDDDGYIFIVDLFKCKINVIVIPKYFKPARYIFRTCIVLTVDGSGWCHPPP